MSLQVSDKLPIIADAGDIEYIKRYQEQLNISIHQATEVDINAKQLAYLCATEYLIAWEHLDIPKNIWNYELELMQGSTALSASHLELLKQYLKKVKKAWNGKLYSELQQAIASPVTIFKFPTETDNIKQLSEELILLQQEDKKDQVIYTVSKIIKLLQPRSFYPNKLKNITLKFEVQSKQLEQLSYQKKFIDTLQKIQENIQNNQQVTKEDETYFNDQVDFAIKKIGIRQVNEYWIELTKILKQQSNRDGSADSEIITYCKLLITNFEQQFYLTEISVLPCDFCNVDVFILNDLQQACEHLLLEDSMQTINMGIQHILQAIKYAEQYQQIYSNTEQLMFSYQENNMKQIILQISKIKKCINSQNNIDSFFNHLLKKIENYFIYNLECCSLCVSLLNQVFNHLNIKTKSLVFEALVLYVSRDFFYTALITDCLATAENNKAPDLKNTLSEFSLPENKNKLTQDLHEQLSDILNMLATIFDTHYTELESVPSDISFLQFPINNLQDYKTKCLAYKNLYQRLLRSDAGALMEKLLNQWFLLQEQYGFEFQKDNLIDQKRLQIDNDLYTLSEKISNDKTTNFKYCQIISNHLIEFYNLVIQRNIVKQQKKTEITQQETLKGLALYTSTSSNKASKSMNNFNTKESFQQLEKLIKQQLSSIQKCLTKNNTDKYLLKLEKSTQKQNPVSGQSKKINQIKKILFQKRGLPKSLKFKFTVKTLEKILRK